MATLKALKLAVARLFKIFKLKGTPTNKTWPNFEQMGHFSPVFPRWQETLSLQDKLQCLHSTNHIRELHDLPAGSEKHCANSRCVCLELLELSGRVAGDELQEGHTGMSLPPHLSAASARGHAAALCPKL